MNTYQYLKVLNEKLEQKTISPLHVTYGEARENYSEVAEVIALTPESITFYHDSEKTRISFIPLNQIKFISYYDDTK